MVWTFEQLPIIERKATSTVVIASPGSGKTTVLTKHIEHVVMDLHISPDRISAVTFTRQAAQHMLAKLKSYPNMSLRSLESLRIGTFHSQMFKALLAERSDIPVLLNAREQGAMMKQSIELVRGVQTSVTAVVLSHYMTRYSSCVGKLEQTDDKIEKRIFQSYINLKSKTSRWDYEDILLNTVSRLQTNCPIRYLASLEYLLLDEFQDTNALQWTIVSILHQQTGVPIFVVGDDDQAIYGFRGSSPRFLQRSAAHLHAGEPYLLTHNFRSDKAVIDSATNLIAHASERISKPMKSVRGGQGEVFAVRVQDSRHEADCVLNMLLVYSQREWVQSIGVLARTRKQLHDIWTISRCAMDNGMFSCSDLQFRTFHDSKGKEWDMVILLDMVTVNRTKKHLRRRDDDEYSLIENVEEERRLCYVAMTRARHVLIAVVPEERNGIVQLPSPFLAEAKLPIYRYARGM